MSGRVFSSKIDANVHRPYGSSITSGSQTKINHKRWQACVSCRRDKIRCLATSPGNPCQSCMKKSRTCVTPGPPKPRIRTAQKFSELETKIQLLQNALTDRTKGDEVSVRQRERDDTHTPSYIYSSNQRGNQRLSESAQQPKIPHSACSRVDEVISITGVDFQTAQMLFNHWNISMLSSSPLVVTSPSGSEISCRTTTPLFYLTILTVASSSILPDMTHRLVSRLNDELSRRIYCLGEQSPEMVYSLLLFSHYFIPSKDSTNFVFIHHPYIASVMSFDLGLDRKARSTSIGDIEVAEAARVWLAAYYTMSVSRTLIRRQRLDFELRDIDLIAEKLSMSQCAVDADRRLCKLVRLQRIVDDCSFLFGSRNIDWQTSIEEQATQDELRSLRGRLDDWRHSQRTKDVRNAASNSNLIFSRIETTLNDHQYHSVRLYMHKITICALMQKHFSSSTGHENSDHNIAEPLSSLLTDGLHECLQSAREIFQTFLSLEIAVIRTLPTSFLYWNIFAAASLVKMAPFAEHLPMPTQPVAEGLPNTDNIPTTTELLERMALKLEEVSKDGYMPQARPFLVAFKRLRVWYVQKKAFCINNRSYEKEECGDAEHNLLSSTLVPQSSNAGFTETATSRRIEDSTIHADQHRSEQQQDGMQTQDSDLSSGITATHYEDEADLLGNEDMDWSFALDAEALKQLDEFLMSQDYQWVEALL